MNRSQRFALALLAAVLVSAPARADKGDVITTFTLGGTVLTESLAGGRATNLTQVLPFSEFVGAGYYVTDRLRLGLNLQFTEALGGPAPGRFTIFSFLPHVTYVFAKPFFASVVGIVSPYFAGEPQFATGVQGVAGAAFPIARRLAASVAVEVPFVLTPVRTVALTPLVGLAYTL